MPHIGNVKGEQGGVYKSAGQQFLVTEQKDYALGFVCITDTILASITQAGFDGTESELVGASLLAGTYVPGSITELTPTSGIVQLQFH